MKEDKPKLTRSLKKKRANKDLLRTEINNATDPNIRLELTKMLIEIENSEKRNKRIGWGILFVFLIILFFFLFYIGGKTSTGNPTTKTSKTQATSSKASSITKESNVSDSSESSPIETRLSDTQLKNWVLVTVKAMTGKDGNHTLDVSINDTDHLAYISVGNYQTDGFGIFRVTAQGVLEFTPSMGAAHWEVISKKYLDTSLAEEYYQINVKDSSDNISIDEVKSYLIGKKYTIIPTHYDGIDATQAVQNQQAPEYLLDEGLDVLFNNENTAHVNLIGNYRSDHDEPYSVTPTSINMNNYTIPYTFKNGSIVLKTFTTNSNGHTITWLMSPQ